jgi:hypothetical protein
MAEVCVVHLVWAPLGLEPFAQFVASYRQKQAGMEHDLVVVFNGFRAAGECRAYHRLLGGLAYEALVLPRPMLDIPAYYAAARHFGHNYFCFLNSYSVILDDGWLAKLYRHITRPGVGLVGASGSYETRHPGEDAWPPFRWRPMFGLLWRLRFREFAAEYRAWRELRYRSRYFDPFPNPHIRTNAFLISRDVLLRVQCPPVRCKLDAWRFEHGKDSLTRQVLGMGLRALVVGRDGAGYEMDRWFESCTFRSGGQRNLLVADNQTRWNMEAGPDTRQLMAEWTWGEKGHTACSV